MYFRRILHSGLMTLTLIIIHCILMRHLNQLKEKIDQHSEEEVNHLSVLQQVPSLLSIKRQKITYLKLLPNQLEPIMQNKSRILLRQILHQNLNLWFQLLVVDLVMRFHLLECQKSKSLWSLLDSNIMTIVIWYPKPILKLLLVSILKEIGQVFRLLIEHLRGKLSRLIVPEISLKEHLCKYMKLHNQIRNQFKS